MLCRQRDKAVFLVAVRFLSNLFSRAAFYNSEPQISRMAPEQTNAAMELLLSGPHQRAHSAEISIFLESLKLRGIDVSNTRVIGPRGRVTYAVLPAVLPGRTLMLISGTPLDGLAKLDAATLVSAVTGGIRHG